MKGSGGDRERERDKREEGYYDEKTERLCQMSVKEIVINESNN